MQAAEIQVIQFQFRNLFQVLKAGKSISPITGFKISVLAHWKEQSSPRGFDPFVSLLKRANFTTCCSETKTITQQLNKTIIHVAFLYKFQE